MISATKIKYDMNIMHFISLFEAITRVHAKDCFDDNGRLVFVVQKGEIGKAIGKQGCNIKIMEDKLKKKIRIVEFEDDVVDFVRNMIAPLRVEGIADDDGMIMIKGNDTKTKGLLIGRESQNMKRLGSVVRRYFKIRGIKVV